MGRALYREVKTDVFNHNGEGREGWKVSGRGMGWGGVAREGGEESGGIG